MYVSVSIQEKALKLEFPESTTVVRHGVLTWEGYFSPKPFSPIYKIRIIYRVGHHPDVYVVKPRVLDLYPGKRKLPHVYSTKKQHICLYLDSTEWNRSKLLTQTVVLWAGEWLFFYETWLETGEWKGGGTHPENQ